jgi:hypothetical protein
MRVRDAEAAVMQELKAMTMAETAWATTRMSETTFEEMFNTIADSLSDLASSNNEQDGEDKDGDEEDTEHGKLSDDKPGWLLGKISKKVQYCMENCWREAD